MPGMDGVRKHLVDQERAVSAEVSDAGDRFGGERPALERLSLASREFRLDRHGCAAPGARDLVCGWLGM